MATEQRFIFSREAWRKTRGLTENDHPRRSKPWWRKVIWPGVLAYILAVLVAFTLGLELHLAWHGVILLVLLFGVTTCSLLRNYYR